MALGAGRGVASVGACGIRSSPAAPSGPLLPSSPAATFSRNVQNSNSATARLQLPAAIPSAAL